jgi:hypothetical protein
MANPNKRIVLPPALGCYVFIWEPRDPPPGSTGDPKYSISLLWPKSDLNSDDQKKSLRPLREAIAEVAKAKFGDKALDLLKIGKLKNPLRDGNIERPEDPVYADHVFVTASSKSQPGIVNGQLQKIFEKDEAYSGCTFRASVSVFAYDNVSKGVGIGLSNLQVVKKGQRLDNRREAEQDFEGYKEEGGVDVDAGSDTGGSSKARAASDLL